MTSLSPSWIRSSDTASSNRIQNPSGSSQGNIGGNASAMRWGSFKRSQEPHHGRGARTRSNPSNYGSHIRTSFKDSPASVLLSRTLLAVDGRGRLVPELPRASDSICPRRVSSVHILMYSSSAFGGSGWPSRRQSGCRTSSARRPRRGRRHGHRASVLRGG